MGLVLLFWFCFALFSQRHDQTVSVQHEPRKNAWKFKWSLKLVMLEKTGTVNVTSKVLEWRSLLTLCYNHPWQSKPKSISLLKMFCRPSFATECFVRVWLCSSRGCWPSTNSAQPALLGFFNQTHGKIGGLCKKKQPQKPTQRNKPRNQGRGTIVQIMASLNEAVEEEGLKEEPEMKMKSQW